MNVIAALQELHEILEQHFWLLMVTFLLSYVVYKMFSGPRNLPPGIWTKNFSIKIFFENWRCGNIHMVLRILGPVGRPLIGAFGEIKDPKNIHKDFMRLGQKYGDVFSIYIGNK